MADILEICSRGRNSICELMDAPAYVEIHAAERGTFSDEELVIPDRNTLAQGYFWYPRDLEPIRLYRIDNLQYSARAHSFTNGEPLNGGNLLPPHPYQDCVKAAANGVDTSAYEAIDSAFVFLHSNFSTYGHFLLEMLPKLLAFSKLNAVCPEIPILVPKNSPSFVTGWIRFLCPDARIIEQSRESQGVTVRQCYMSDMLTTYYMGGAAMSEFIALCQGRAGVAHDPPDLDIYLSRKTRRLDHTDFRNLNNAEEVERIFEDAGYLVVEPEKLPIADQIRLFTRARSVAGELCSALHNAVFAQAGTKVIQINPFNSVQRQIGLWRRHRVVSILPDDRRVRSWPGHGNPDFSLSAADLEHAIYDHEPALYRGGGAYAQSIGGAR